MTLKLTSQYILPLGIIWFVLWVRVVQMRSKLHTSIGDGGNSELHLRIRQFGNFIEWVPFVLVLMIVSELQGTKALWLNIAGLLLVIGRLIHPFGLKIENDAHILRILGNSSNMIAAIILLSTIALKQF
jgi:uncharacterized membrane protein YecN with MAPEG domain